MPLSARAETGERSLTITEGSPLEVLRRGYW